MSSPISPIAPKLPRPRMSVNTFGTRLRFFVIFLVVLIGLHTILSYMHDGYRVSNFTTGLASKFSNTTSSSSIHGFPTAGMPAYDATGARSSAAVATSTPVAGSTASSTPITPSPDRHISSMPMAKPRMNATFMMLARNSDVDGAVRSMRRLEDRFNHMHNYPWTFLNDEPFTEEFKRRVSVLTDAKVEFGVIPRDHWEQPEWIDEQVAEERRKLMVEEEIPYAGSVSYRNMCRFNSGFFYRHPLMLQYRWYWRVEPDVDFTCNINFDPFEFMEKNNKTYGFTIALSEIPGTIPTLWDTTKEFIKDYPHHIAPNNAMSFLSDNDGQDYTLCHFWSNFEIADLDFWRGEAYTDFFDLLEEKGGFYYERWGDAPVHSIAVSLLLDRSQLHFFDPIGYEHPPFNHCPGREVWAEGRCSCNSRETFDFHWDWCKWRYDAMGWF